MLETYSRNKLVWPVSLLFTFLAWILNGWFGLGGKTVANPLLSPFFDYLLGMVVCAFAVYLIAELTTRYSLLANTDRTISLTMMLLVAMATFLHPLQPSQLVLICYLISYLVLLGAYQSRQAPAAAFSVNLLLGISTIVCPQLVWLAIANIFAFGLLRALTLKSVVASLLGLMVPYWFWGVLSPWVGVEGAFAGHLAQMATFGKGGLGMLSAKELWSFWTVLVMFVVGGADFFLNIHQNRSRMRMVYDVVCLQGVVSFFFIWAEPQLFVFLFPLAMVNTSILWGHFTSFAKGRIPDIVFSCVVVLWVIATLFIG